MAEKQCIIKTIYLENHIKVYLQSGSKCKATHLTQNLSPGSMEPPIWKE